MQRLRVGPIQSRDPVGREEGISIDNFLIADRLDAFAVAARARRRQPVHGPRLPPRRRDDPRRRRRRSPSSCATGRVRELRGIGPGIEARLRELVETGEIAELAELERELAPDLVGLGRYLGLSAKRSVEIARALGVRTPDELREAAAAGRLRTRAGHRAEDRGAAPRGARPRGRAATAARAAAQPRVGARGRRSRPRSTARRPATCGAGATPASSSRWCAPRRDPAAGAGALRRAAADRRGGRAGRAARGRRHGRGRAGRARRRRAASGFGTALVRATGLARATWRRSSRCPTRRTRQPLYRALGLPWCPPELREEPFRGEPPALVEPGDIRGDLHCHTTWSDGRASVEEMGRAARERGYEYLAICDHTPAVGAVRGLTADDVRRQARGDRGGQRGAGAVPRPARDRVRHPPRRAARPPRRRARGARLGAGQRARRAADAARGS